jgi:hypothetical protein
MMGSSITTTAVLLGFALGMGPHKSYPTHGARNPNSAPAEVLAEAVPLGSDGRDHTLQRAGHPYCVSKIAKPGVTPQYGGYYVGGGCILPCLSGPLAPHWGTFGLDYCQNKLFRYHVRLGWCCPERRKGGVGSYRTDGPPVPNIFAIHLPEREQPVHETCHGEYSGVCLPSH